MLIKFSDSIIRNKPEIFEYAQNSFFTTIINYIIDSKYRKSVNLVPWIKDQVNNPSQSLLDFEKTIINKENYDEQILEILIAVRKMLKYVPDSTQWSMDEKWQLADQSVVLKKGDCEDGCILIYILARLKGIPANRLLIFAGDVSAGENLTSGHCWLGYKPNNYPLNFAFIDWCYWADFTKIDIRNLFRIDHKTIIEYEQPNTKTTTKNYIEIWFGFNELKSYISLDYNFEGIIDDNKKA